MKEGGGGRRKSRSNKSFRKRPEDGADNRPNSTTAPINQPPQTRHNSFIRHINRHLNGELASSDPHLLLPPSSRPSDPPTDPPSPCNSETSRWNQVKQFQFAPETGSHQPRRSIAMSFPLLPSLPPSLLPLWPFSFLFGKIYYLI